MIRILHIVTYMGRGGLETMLMNYYRHMPRDKIQFDFLVHRDFTADYDREISSMGGKIYHFPRLIPWSCSYRRQLMAFFNEHPEYRVVHVHQDCLSAVALACAKQCGVPVRIVHSHVNNQDINWKYPLKCYYRNKIPFFATDFFACSQSAGEWMFKGHTFSVIPNAIDANSFVYRPETAKEMRRRLHIDANTCVIGHVGRFHPQKNHSFLIDIFYAFLSLHPESILLLAGEGSGRAAIQKKVHLLGISSHVYFTGSRTDIPDLLQAMDVFVFPSHYEGLGISIVEAQASGLPCLISDTIPKECMVTDHLVFRYSLKKPPDMWAKKIASLLHIPKRTRTDEILQAGYDLTDTAKKLAAFYTEAEGRNSYGTSDNFHANL